MNRERVTYKKIFKHVFLCPHSKNAPIKMSLFNLNYYKIMITVKICIISAIKKIEIIYRIIYPIPL